MNVEKVVVYRIKDRTVSTPVQSFRGIQYANGISMNTLRQKAEWVNVFTKEKNNVR